MKNNYSMMKVLVIGIIILFIISAISPIVFGYNVKTADNDQMDKNFNRYLYSKYYDYYNVNKSFDYTAYFNSLVLSNSKNIKSGKISNSEMLSLSFDGPMNSAWPTQCHDNHHRGQSPYSTADNPGIEKWRVLGGQWIEQGAVIDNDGIIYFGEGWGDLIALYPDGTLKWKYELDGQILGSTPAIAEDGTIYVGAWDGRLYAINSDGTKKWRCSTHGSIASSPVIAEDGTIYIGNYDRKIVAVNPNGTIYWYYNLGDDTTSDPCIGDDGTIYIGSFDSYFYAFHPNGTLKWRFKTGDKIYGSASIAEDGTIYIGSSWDTYLYALYPDGTMKWKYKGAGTPNNPSIGNDGTIYAGYLYHLYALYPNGTLKWKFYIGNDRFIGKSAPAISADGTIYFGIHLGIPGYRDGGEIIALNPDGTEKWRKKIANYWVESSPSIAEDGTIYIGSSYDMSGGYIHAFGTQESNDSPNKPSITGPSEGKVGTPYDYTFKATDPDKNPVSYFVDWGDGETTGWTSDYASGEKVTLSHTWSVRGNYIIKAKAKDTFGLESEKGTLTVTIPRDKATNTILILRLLERFPLLQKLIQQQWFGL